MPYGWTDEEWQQIISKEQQDDIDADQRVYDREEAHMLRHMDRLGDEDEETE
jgi:hypothetical protein